jgi:hypothetical protein
MKQAIVLDTPDQIQFFQIARLCSALKLEMIGLKHSRGSVYAYCKRTYGLKGNKAKVLEAMTKIKNDMLEAAGA